jgi:hypothetical protein
VRASNKSLPNALAFFWHDYFAEKLLSISFGFSLQYLLQNRSVLELKGNNSTFPVIASIAFPVFDLHQLKLQF